MIRRRRVLIGLELDVADASAIGINVDFGGNRLGEEVDPPGLERLGQGLAGVVLGLNRADRHAVIVALTAPALLDLAGAHGSNRNEAFATIVIGIRDPVPALRKASNLQLVTLPIQLDLGAVNALGDHLVEIRKGQSAHRKNVTLGEGISRYFWSSTSPETPISRSAIW